MWNFKISQSEYIVGEKFSILWTVDHQVWISLWETLSVNQKNCTILFILADSELPAPPCDG